MKPIQLLLITFIVFALAKVIQKYIQRGIGIRELFFWAIVWSGTVFIVILPDSTSVIAEILGIGRGADLVIYISLVLLFYLIFRVNLTLDRFNQEITEVVRMAALEQLARTKDSPAPGTPQAGQQKDT